MGSRLMVDNCRDCPQGGVLSLILWSLIVDELLDRVHFLGIKCLGYADDITIVVRGKFPNTVTDLMGSALKKVEKWCLEVGLSVNPDKTHLVPFTRKKTVGFKKLKFFGKNLVFSNEVKYLGVIFDKTLTWNAHLKYCTTKAKRIF